MARTPFTQDLLHQILDDTGTMSIELLTQALPDWTEQNIKQRLALWQYRSVIDYTLKDGELDTFRFVEDKRVLEENISEGKKLKLEEYYKQVVATAEIMNKPTASDSNRLKAIQLQQIAMDKIPDSYFKELNEINA